MKKVLFCTSIITIVILIFTSMQGLFQISTYPFIRQLEKRRILKEVNEYNTLNSEHFYIKFSKIDEGIAIETGKILEEYFDKICGKLNYFPKEKIPVIIYSNVEDFKSLLNLDEEIAPLGAYYCGIINILSPSNWMDINKFDDIGNIYREKGPHVHEFIHFIVDEKTKGNYPLWLTEGIALYMEEELLGSSWNLGIGETDKITIEYLDKNFTKIEVGLAYRKSYELIKGMIDKYGLGDFNQLLDNLGHGRDIEKSVKIVFKTEFSEIK